MIKQIFDNINYLLCKCINGDALMENGLFLFKCSHKPFPTVTKYVHCTYRPTLLNIDIYLLPFRVHRVVHLHLQYFCLPTTNSTLSSVLPGPSDVLKHTWVFCFSVASCQPNASTCHNLIIWPPVMVTLLRNWIDSFLHWRHPAIMDAQATVTSDLIYIKYAGRLGS